MNKILVTKVKLSSLYKKSEYFQHKSQQRKIHQCNYSLTLIGLFTTALSLYQSTFIECWVLHINMCMSSDQPADLEMRTKNTQQICMRTTIFASRCINNTCPNTLYKFLCLTMVYNGILCCCCAKKKKRQLTLYVPVSL